MKTQREMKQYVTYLKRQIRTLDVERFPFIVGELTRELRETQATMQAWSA